MVEPSGERRAIITGLVGILALAGVAAVATLVGYGRSRTSDVVAGPARSALPEGSTMPAEIVTLAPDEGIVAVIDSLTGRRRRVLAVHRPGPEPTGRLQGVAVDTHRRLVYYALASPGCETGRTYRVSLDRRARPETVAEGISPAVSPDGRYLAYAARSSARGDGRPACFNAVVVRDLRTGAERTWRYPETEIRRNPLFAHASFTKLAWAPDARRLAFVVSYEGDSISVLDTASHRDLFESVEVVIPDGGGDSSQPAWQASSGRLAVVNRAFACCFEDNYTGPPRTLLVNVEARRSEALLPPGIAPTWLDFDASGDHVLYVDGGRLYRRSQDHPPVPVTSGYAAVDW